MSSEPHLTKKEQVRKRNWLHNIINLVASVHHSLGQSQEPAALEPEQEVGSFLAAERKRREEMVWSERVGDVRNRVTGHRRQATDRWNRMAGTSASGARGR